MNFTEWRHSRKRTTDDEDGSPCYEYGPGRNIIHILETGYGLMWMGHYEESPILLDLEVKLYNFATRDGCL